MQWTSEPQGGFTQCANPRYAVIDEGPYSFEHVNVAIQRRDPNSMLNWIERMIRMRKEVAEFGWGDFELLETGTPATLAIRYDWRNNSVLAIHNLSATPREVRFKTGLADGMDRWLINVLSEAHSRVDESGSHCVLLEGYGYRWYRAGSMNYVQTRSEA